MSDNSKFSFNEKDHSYWYRGQRLPGVTECIRFLAPTWNWTEEARQRGVAIHKLVHLECLGKLAEIPDWMIGIYEAWLRFVEETGFQLSNSERPLYHRDLLFAGTPDLIGLIYEQSTAVIDLKRFSADAPLVGIQTAGYSILLPDRPGAGVTRFGLQLRDDGQYRLEEFKDHWDFQVFFACLTITKWRMKHET